MFKSCLKHCIYCAHFRVFCDDFGTCSGINKAVFVASIVCSVVFLTIGVLLGVVGLYLI